MKLTSENAILPFTSTADLTSKEGYAVQNETGGSVSLFSAIIGKKPFVIIVHGTSIDEKSSIAVLSGGLGGTVKVKIAAPVEVGTILGVQSGGDFMLSTHVSADFACAQALEEGVAGEMIEAVLFKPEALNIA